MLDHLFVGETYFTRRAYKHLYGCRWRPVALDVPPPRQSLLHINGLSRYYTMACLRNSDAAMGRKGELTVSEQVERTINTMDILAFQCMADATTLVAELGRFFTGRLGRRCMPWRRGMLLQLDGSVSWRSDGSQQTPHLSDKLLVVGSLWLSANLNDFDVMTLDIHVSVVWQR